jgi:DNA-binding NarL/FixJ family response regulator
MNWFDAPQDTCLHPPVPGKFAAKRATQRKRSKKYEGCGRTLVLVDMSMPGTNGLDTARLIRKEMPEIKILIMSHHDPQVLTTAALEAGADACVDKSTLSLDALIKAVDSGQ